MAETEIEKKENHLSSEMAVVKNELHHMNGHLARLEAKIDGFQQLQVQVMAIKGEVEDLKEWKKKTEGSFTWLTRLVYGTIIVGALTWFGSTRLK